MASTGAKAVRLIRIVKLLQHAHYFKSRSIKEIANDLGDTSAADLGKKLEEFVTIHILISVLSMLVLAMALSLAQSYDLRSSQMQTIRLYVRPISECETAACTEMWQASVLPDMLETFEKEPFHAPIIYLCVNGITLYGTPNTYKKLFRKKPKSFVLRTLSLAVDGMVGQVHFGNKQ